MSDFMVLAWKIFLKLMVNEIKLPYFFLLTLRYLFGKCLLNLFIYEIIYLY